ncbi:uracil-DNA glycosylase [Sphingomonas sp. NSE70-1]|uniref:Uracil-DNA glycosylase n=1 Tax=Sphingomonas caseinilyticus TaxID=2908205 RepID=A0ABT0RRJ7_9SPHN|nr:uracil-DNA glycosylase [Sphingomonas caseinilyticus]MCL6697536.1 uracil-DNA glycosylase [Sphingomonas caseinilyticus]
MQAIDRGAAASLVGWWLEAGVDAAVSETPRDWLGRQKSLPEAVPATPPPTENPADLAAFQAWLATAAGLPMDRPGAIRVASHGPETAKVMLLSDLPAREDVADDKPIGGEAWALTNRMLAAIGIGTDEAYVASLSPFHAPGARFNGDLDACAGIARDHIRLARPERLILFGDAPAKALIGEPLARARGKVHRVEGIRTIATFHPRWLLQRPSDKALAWRDLLLLMSESD